MVLNKRGSSGFIYYSRMETIEMSLLFMLFIESSDSKQDLIKFF